MELIPADQGLMAELSVIARRFDASAQTSPPSLVPSPSVVSVRSDRLVVRFGDVVFKVHEAGTDATALAARLAIAADPRLGGAMLAPLPIPGGDDLAGVRAADVPGSSAGIAAQVGDRFVSAWPAGAALGPDDVDHVPWEQAAALLASLHAPPALAAASERALVSTGRPVPRALAFRRVERAVGRLTRVGDPSAEAIRAAYATLPPWVRRNRVRPGGTEALIHGDWHLGQLLRLEGRRRRDHSTSPMVARSLFLAAPDADGDTSAPGGPGGTREIEERSRRSNELPVVRAGDVPGSPGGRHWRIIDVDDLGVGDPAWDLARPAAWFAAGLLAPQAWERLLRGYQEAGGRAWGEGGDPWAALDGPARALTVQYAANAVADREPGGEPLDGVARAFVECCRRMAKSGSPDAHPVGRLPASSGVQ